MAEYNSYIICATPRSGSTLLCKLLSATGVAGKPNSYFHQPCISAWLKSLDLTPEKSVTKHEVLREVLNAVRQKGTADTNIFGLRLMRKSFDFLMEQLDLLYPNLASDTDRFNAAFGRTLYIHLTRSDKLAQAISLVKADQTGLWHMAPDGTELERMAPPQEPTYDAAQIQQQMLELTAFDSTWANWFETEKITPLRVTYEALAADPAGNLAYILDRLGLDSNVARGVEPGVAKLADQTSRNWAERFRTENAGA